MKMNVPFYFKQKRDQRSLFCRRSSIALHCPSSWTISERGHAVRTKSVCNRKKVIHRLSSPIRTEKKNAHRAAHPDPVAKQQAENINARNREKIVRRPRAVARAGAVRR